MSSFQKSSILAQLSALIPHKPRKIALLGLAGLLVSGAVAGIAVTLPDETTRISRPLITELESPDTTVIDLPPQPFTRETTVRAGDTPPAVFARLGINDPVLMAFVQLRDEGRKLVARIRPGSVIEARTAQDGLLQSLLIHAGDSEQAQELIRRNDTFSLRDTVLPVVRGEVAAAGTIRSSLFAATDAADLPDSISAALIDIFSGQINFHTDLRKGDRFSILYEAVYYKGSLLHTGRILAADFTVRGHHLNAVWFGTAPQGGAYYTAKGQSLRQSFLRAPVEFSRVSASFAERDHPFLQSWQQHKGTDFAAPTGTKVLAAANGVVDFVGAQNGYGNFIIVKHDRGYSTAYGHLNDFAKGLRKGQRVKQGEVIGFVGMTGWATGPHLHYEFRINGTSVDPMTVALPNQPTLTGAQLQAFRGVADPLMARLNSNTAVALNLYSR